MNEIPLIVLLTILTVLLIISAAFSNPATVLDCLNRFRLRYVFHKKHKLSAKTEELLYRPDLLIELISLGNHLVYILVSALTTVMAMQFGGLRAIAPSLIVLIAVSIFAKMLLKSTAPIKPAISVFLSAYIYIPLIKILYPLASIGKTIIHFILKILHVNPPKFKNDAGHKEETPETQQIPGRYQNMLRRMLDLETGKVEDIMTNRNDILGIDIEDPIEDIIHKLQNSPHTRLPVYKKNIDRIIGFIHLRTILAQLIHPDFDKHYITEHMTKPFFIPAGTSIHRQIQTFKTEHLRIGLVVDEYGDVLGLISLDDLIQEIVGELIAEEPNIKIEKDGSYLVDASVTIRELNRVAQWRLPTDGPKTLNGLIIEYMETIPEAGISVKLHGHILEIIKCDENTVKLVKFHGQVH